MCACEWGLSVVFDLKVRLIQFWFNFESVLKYQCWFNAWMSTLNQRLYVNVESTFVCQRWINVYMSTLNQRLHVKVESRFVCQRLFNFQIQIYFQRYINIYCQRWIKIESTDSCPLGCCFAVLPTWPMSFCHFAVLLIWPIFFFAILLFCSLDQNFLPFCCFPNMTELVYTFTLL